MFETINLEDAVLFCQSQSIDYFSQKIEQGWSFTEEAEGPENLSALTYVKESQFLSDALCDFLINPSPNLPSSSLELRKKIIEEEILLLKGVVYAQHQESTSDIDETTVLDLEDPKKLKKRLGHRLKETLKRIARFEVAPTPKNHP